MRASLCYVFDEAVVYPVHKATGAALDYSLYDIIRFGMEHVVLNNTNMAVGSLVREMVRDELTPTWSRTTMPS